MYLNHHKVLHGMVGTCMNLDHYKVLHGMVGIYMSIFKSQDGYDAGYLYRFSMEEAGPHFDPYESTCTIPVPALPGALPDNDVPIQSLTFRYIIRSVP